MAGMRVSRFVSTGLYSGWLAWAAAHFNLPQVFGTALALLFPLVLVWFPQEFNELALGTLEKNGAPQSPVPSWVVAACGWFLFLLLLPLTGAVAAG